MKRIILALAILLASTVAATATPDNFKCFHVEHVWRCIVFELPSRAAKVIPVKADNSPEAREREAAWIAECKPVIRTDADGIRRYSYAKPGCEYERVN